MKKTILILGIVILLAIAGFFIFNEKLTGNVIKQEGNVKTFYVDAFRFGYSPEIIVVNQGDKVKIYINNTDTLHGIRIPDLGIKGNEMIEFTADKKGEFTWYCANMCGNEHMQMQGKIIIE